MYVDDCMSSSTLLYSTLLVYVSEAKGHPVCPWQRGSRLIKSFTFVARLVFTSPQTSPLVHFFACKLSLALRAYRMLT